MQIGAPNKRGYKAKRGQEQGEVDARRRKSLEELSADSLGPRLLFELHSLRRDGIKSHKTARLELCSGPKQSPRQSNGDSSNPINAPPVAPLEPYRRR